jgi:hypothetical protein
MSRWQNFLNSLSTRGGAILMLFAICVVGMVVILHMIHHGEESSMFAGAVLGTFSAFSGALLLALKGSSEASATASSGPGGPTVTASTTPTANPPVPETNERSQ